MGEKIRHIQFSDAVTDDQQLAITTCPSFDRMKQRALDDYYERKLCVDCDVRVQFTPHIDRLAIEGNCPKK